MKPNKSDVCCRRKLQEWRESRGITYKRPPMPVRLVRRKTVSALPQPYWTAMEQEDKAHHIVFAVDRSLDDCIKLLQQVIFCIVFYNHGFKKGSSSYFSVLRGGKMKSF